MGSLKWPANGQKVFQSSATQIHPLGARGEDRFGRTFRYCLAGAADLIVGNVIQSAAQIANHQAMAPSATAIGDKTISVTPGNTAGAANLYAGGIAVIQVAPGIGYSYPIKAHPAIVASTLFTIQLVEGWEVQVALTNATSKVTLSPNPFAGVIQSPVTTLTGTPVGVCPFIISATQYGWLGTGGAHGTLIQGTPGVGQAVSAPASAAGAAAINSGTLPILGYINQTGVDAQVSPVDWILN